MGHTGGYSREEAIAAIDEEGTLPDMLTYNPARPARYPNGRVFSDDVIWIDDKGREDLLDRWCDSVDITDYVDNI